MADFSPELQSFKPSSFSFPDFMDPNLELMGHYSASNPAPPSLNFTNLLPFSNDMFFPHQPPPELLHGNFPLPPPPPISAPQNESFHDLKKRKSSMEFSESTSGISTPQASENGFKSKNVCNGTKPVIVDFTQFFTESWWVCLFSAELGKREEIEKR